MKISIAEEMKERCPFVCLGILQYKVEVKESSDTLIKLFDDTVDDLSGKLILPEIAGLENIKATREAYKALGKPPQGYRNSAEAMLRRIAKGNGLYHINNVVDLNNLISIMSGYSLGSYDTDKLFGDIVLNRAKDGERYEGIGKDFVNIEHLPVLYDEKGAFGNPTSDSTRAMIQPGYKTVMSVIYSFGIDSAFLSWMDRYDQMLREFCYCTDIKTQIIK